MKVLDWILRIVPAVILLQTLFFKFSGAEESIAIFSQLGAEPLGRYASGVAELIVALLLLVPRTAWMGALGAMGIMTGAILSHLFVLGIEVAGDGGTLFVLAITVFVCSAVVFVMHRNDSPFFGDDR